MTPTIETARVVDLDVIRALLAASDLPIDDVDQHIDEFLLAKWQDRTIGTVAVEYAAEAALLRSLCVVPEYRGQAVGSRLISAIEANVASRGVLELYLLTTTAVTFFERQGFSRIGRAGAPRGIQGTAQFRMLCPTTAVCMYKRLKQASAPGLAGDASAPPR